jgi:transcriptional regulator with XRE-family HTH domain
VTGNQADYPMSDETRNAYQIGSFGQYFSQLVKSSAFRSQHEVAVSLGVSQRAISNYMVGSRIPSATMCEKIAMVFGVSIAEVRAAAGKPLPTSIDATFDTQIRSLMLGIDWTPERLTRLRSFLQEVEDGQ